MGDHSPRLFVAEIWRHPSHKPSLLSGRVARVFHLEVSPLAGEHGPYTLRERGRFSGVQARRRFANAQVVGALGNPRRVTPVGLGERPPHPIHGNYFARLVQDSYVW